MGWFVVPFVFWAGYHGLFRYATSTGFVDDHEAMMAKERESYAKMSKKDRDNLEYLKGLQHPSVPYRHF